MALAVLTTTLILAVSFARPATFRLASGGGGDGDVMCQKSDPRSTSCSGEAEANLPVAGKTTVIVTPKPESKGLDPSEQRDRTEHEKAPNCDNEKGGGSGADESEPSPSASAGGAAPGVAPARPSSAPQPTGSTLPPDIEGFLDLMQCVNGAEEYRELCKERGWIICTAAGAAAKNPLQKFGLGVLCKKVYDWNCNREADKTIKKCKAEYHGEPAP